MHDQTAADPSFLQDLARRVASLEAMRSACHIVHAANMTKRGVGEVGDIYFRVGGHLGLDWLRVAAEHIAPESHWERLAIAVIVEDLFGQQRALALKVLDAAGRRSGDAAITSWVDASDGVIQRGERMIAEFKAAGTIDVAQLALANRQVRAMIVS